MQVPRRASEQNRKYSVASDHFLSAAAIAKLRAELERLQKVVHPRAAEELRRASEMGDRSENAAYSEAKGRLMRVNTRILELQDELRNAVEIPEGSVDGRVAIGATVVVRVGGLEKTYQITGSAETAPASGRISFSSPLGAVLMGHRAGDEVLFRAADGREVKYVIVDVQ
jgi:transcription elongation factor GreA